VSADRLPRLQSPLGICRCDVGGTAIEFAIVMPVLVMLLIGIVGLGWALHGIASVNYAIERVGRHLQLNEHLVTDQLQAELDSILDGLGRQNASLALELRTDAFGTRMADVTASYQFVLRVPLLNSYAIQHEKTAVVILGAAR
jgi:hypothetical protein